MIFSTTNELPLGNLRDLLSSPVHVDPPLHHNKDVDDLVAYHLEAERHRLSCACRENGVLVHQRADRVRDFLEFIFQLDDVLLHPSGLIFVPLGLLLLLKRNVPRAVRQQSACTPPSHHGVPHAPLPCGKCCVKLTCVTTVYDMVRFSRHLEPM